MIDNFALIWAIAGLGYVLWRIIRIERGNEQAKSASNRIGQGR